MPKTTPTPLALLKSLEWSSHQLGQGSGPMGSGGDGRAVRACPVCHGIDPTDSGKLEFIESSHGHKKTCVLNQVINKKKKKS